MTDIISSPVQSSPVQSIIIPTYNRKEMLAEAIMSVLKQSQKSLELIVIDDCLTDGTEEYVRSIADERIRYFRNEKNSGLEYNRNLGLKLAHGKYITYLDDDDYYTDYDFYTKAVKIHEDHENDDVPVVMVCANAKLLTVITGEVCVSDIGCPGRVKGLDYIIRPEYHKPPSTFPAVFRADALRRAGLEDMPMFDTMTYVQAAFEGDAWFIPDVIGIYRIHGGNSSCCHKKHNAYNARRYDSARECVRRCKMAAEKLCGMADKKNAYSWYVSEMLNLTSWYQASSRGIEDRLKILGIMFSESGFMPKLWLKLMLLLLRDILKKITPLRMLYRRIFRSEKS